MVNIKKWVKPRIEWVVSTVAIPMDLIATLVIGGLTLPIWLIGFLEGNAQDWYPLNTRNRFFTPVQSLINYLFNM